MPRDKTWYNAATDERTLQARFTEFVLSQRGERVADLMPKDRRLPLNADYLLWDRSVVAELKCLTKDRYHEKERGDKFLKLYASWVHRGLKPRLPPTPPGQLRRHILDTDGLPMKEQRKAAAIFNAPFKAPIGHASRQIRATKRDLNLPNAKGLLIVANLADASLPPKTAWEGIGYEIAQHTNGTFASAIYISPVADRRHGPNGPNLWMSGSCANQEGVDPQLLHNLCVAWDAFVSDGRSRVSSATVEDLDSWPEPPESQR
jgi:hypothetical protein